MNNFFAKRRKRRTAASHFPALLTWQQRGWDKGSTARNPASTELNTTHPIKPKIVSLTLQDAYSAARQAQNGVLKKLSVFTSLLWTRELSIVRHLCGTSCAHENFILRMRLKWFVPGCGCLRYVASGWSKVVADYKSTWSFQTNKICKIWRNKNRIFQWA